MPRLCRLAFVVGFLPVLAAAQPSIEDAGVVESDAGTPMVTTVRGSRGARSASEYVVPQDVVQAAPKQGATDLLRLVPGMVASQHSGAGKAQQLFLRGFDAVHGQDVELDVAGLPVNQVSHLHAVGYADVNWLIPEAVRELHITEGSYRAFQGDFAVAGTVRFDLGLAEQGLLVSASLGQFATQRLVVGFRPGEDESTFAALELSKSDGFGPQRAFGKASLLAQATANVKGARVRVLLGNYVTRFDSPGVVREADVDAGRFTFFQATARGQGGSASRHQLLVGLDLPHDTGRTTFEVYGVLSDLRLRNNFTGYITDERGDGLEQTHNVNTVGARVIHRRSFTLLGNPLSAELGLGAHRDAANQIQRRYRESDGTPYADEVDARFVQSAADAYGELTYSRGGWRFLLGGRADLLGFEIVDTLAFINPRFYDGKGYSRSALGVHGGLKAGIERTLGEHVRLFANYGDGFRSPQARSLADGERAPFVSVRGGEVGGALAFSKLALQLSGFTSFVDDDFFFDHSVGTTVFIGPTLRVGGALQAIARPIENLVISASGTLATAHQTQTGDLLPYFAPTVARIDAGYKRPFTIFGLASHGLIGAGFTLLGPRPLPFEEFSQTVALLDARIGVRIGPAELRFDFSNLLDARWRDGEFVYASSFIPGAPVSRLPSRQFTAGAPRQFSATVEIHI